MELMRQERARGDGTGLRHVSLRGNPIGDVGMDALALGIKANDTLHWLVLSDCKIEERGAATLGLARGLLRTSTQPMSNRRNDHSP